MRSAFLLVVLLFVARVSAATEFRVSPTGDDANPGTAERPFATLARAREAVRAAPAGAPRSVEVGAGTYRLADSFALDAKDSGTAEAPVVWRAAAGSEVRLTRGTPVPAAAWKTIADAADLARIDPAARPHVRRASLDGIVPARVAALPDRLRGPILLPELYVNDARMALAGWPNEGWATLARVADPGSDPSAGEKPDRGGVVEYEGDRPARWRPDLGLWLRGFWRYDWDEELIRVQGIDPASHRITLAAPALYGLKPGNPSPRRFRAINVLEELDAPGEFYFDREAHAVFLWPPADLDTARVEVAGGASPVVRIEGASHVALRGFILENTLSDAVVIRDGDGVSLEACEVRHVRFAGVRVEGGTHHRVTGCDIHDTGAGGIILAGGDRRTLIPAGHEAVNNRIERFSLHQIAYTPGIRLAGVGQRAAHNLIADAPHMAVGIDGNDHVFEFNIVRDACKETDDAGALYKGRDPSCRGNVIRYNLWRDIGSGRGHGTAAIYFDDGDGGDTVLGNVFVRCGDAGPTSPFGAVFSHGGHGLVAENNVFIDCPRALGSSPWNDELWQKAVEDRLGWNWRKKLREDVDIAGPVYLARYPELAGFLTPAPGQPRTSRAVRNAVVRCGQASNGNWRSENGANWATDGDPGFVDAAHDDYRLRPDAAVFAALPGFEPIPFEKIGPRGEEHRE